MNGTVFLFDVDNTLLDNDRFEADLRGAIRRQLGAIAEWEYFGYFETLRQELGSADYLGAFVRYRRTHPTETAASAIADFILDYPYARRLYPQALATVQQAKQVGRPVIFSSGDELLQPRKVRRAGLAAAVDEHVLIYRHKEWMLSAVAHRYPAERYVLVDDKPTVLAAVKSAWGDRVTTVLPRQGHYARDPMAASVRPLPDVTVHAIGELMSLDLLGSSGSSSCDFTCQRPQSLPSNW